VEHKKRVERVHCQALEFLVREEPVLIQHSCERIGASRAAEDAVRHGMRGVAFRACLCSLRTSRASFSAHRSPRCGGLRYALVHRLYSRSSLARRQPLVPFRGCPWLSGPFGDTEALQNVSSALFPLGHGVDASPNSAIRTTTSA
jgi:hypothetical protein